MWIINIITTTNGLTCFNTKRIKYRLITININNFWSYLTCLIIIEIQLNRVALNGFTDDKIVNPVKNIFLINPNIFICFLQLVSLRHVSYYSFPLNTYECLKYRQLQ